MEKWIQQNQGIITFLLAWTGLFAAFQIKLQARVVKLEGDVKNSEDAMKEFKAELSEVKRAVAENNRQIVSVEIHTKHITEMLTDIKHTIDKTWEMRFRQ